MLSLLDNTYVGTSSPLCVETWVPQVRRSLILERYVAKIRQRLAVSTLYKYTFVSY